MTTYTYGRDLYDAMLEAIRGARRQILFETYIWKGDEVGEEFKQALIDAAAGRRRLRHLRRLRQPRRLPRFKHFPARAEGAPLPGLRRRLAVLRPAPLRPRPPQDPRRRRRGRLRRRLQHRLGVRHRVARHPLPDHRSGVWDLQRAFADFWNLHRRRRIGRSERPLLLETPSQWEPRIRVHRNVPRLWMFPIRSMYLEAINRATRNIWMTHAYFIPDQDFVDALVDAARRGVDVRLLLPRKSNHIVADWISRGYFSPAARRRRTDPPLPRRDGARQDRDHRRQLVDDRHRQRRPALA